MEHSVERSISGRRLPRQEPRPVLRGSAVGDALVQDAAPRRGHVVGGARAAVDGLAQRPRRAAQVDLGRQIFIDIYE